MSFSFAPKLLKKQPLLPNGALNLHYRSGDLSGVLKDLDPDAADTFAKYLQCGRTYFYKDK